MSQSGTRLRSKPRLRSAPKRSTSRTYTGWAKRSSSQHRCYVRAGVQLCLKRKCLSNVILGKLIGSGSSGSVFEAHIPGDPVVYALKIVPLNTPIPWDREPSCRAGTDPSRWDLDCMKVTTEDFYREIERSRIAAAHNLGPQVQGWWFCKGSSGFDRKPVRYGILMSTLVPGITATQYYKQYGLTRSFVRAMIDILRRTGNLGFQYRDLHGDNVLVAPVTGATKASSNGWRKSPLNAQFVDLADFVPDPRYEPGDESHWMQSFVYDLQTSR
jgi:hypothetical protein